LHIAGRYMKIVLLFMGLVATSAIQNFLRGYSNRPDANYWRDINRPCLDVECSCSWDIFSPYSLWRSGV